MALLDIVKPAYYPDDMAFFSETFPLRKTDDGKFQWQRQNGEAVSEKFDTKSEAEAYFQPVVVPVEIVPTPREN